MESGILDGENHFSRETHIVHDIVEKCGTNWQDWCVHGEMKHERLSVSKTLTCLEL